MTLLRIATSLLTWILVCRASNGMAVDFGLQPNVGQTSPAVSFIARGLNYTAFLAPGGATLRTRDSALKMSFLGANPRSEGIGLDPAESLVHYLLGNHEQWHTDVPIYGRVEYRGVYPGTDIAYYEDRGRLGYTLILNPGAEPAQIRLRFEGGGRVQLDPDGDLLLQASQCEWRHSRAAIYQVRGGGRRKVAGHFIVQGSDEVVVEVGDYDRSVPLTIDMALTYSTYLGEAVRMPQHRLPPT